MLNEIFKMSWHNITQNKIRSFLTILGILIGVTAIITLITIVQGAIDEIQAKMDSLGSGTVMVQAYGTPLKSGLSDNDIESLLSINGVLGFSPTISTTIDVWHDGTISEDVTIDGKNEEYFKRNIGKMIMGREINHFDTVNDNRVCIIDPDLAKEWYPGEMVLGKKIMIGGISYEIIGVYKPDSSSLTYAYSSSSDSIIIPYSNVMLISGMSNIAALDLYIDTNIDTERIGDEIEQKLDEAFNYKDNTYSVIQLDTLIDMIKDMQNMMEYLLIGIASISIVVGGIGIMNMMLVSVSERTMEIGLRKALGATPFMIQLQFLAEAVALSLMGGLAGLILGTLLSILGCWAIGVPFALSPTAITLGVGSSALAGIVFGFTPARKASLLNPIDALRRI